MNITQDLYNIQYGREKQEATNGNRFGTSKDSGSNEQAKRDNEERPTSKEKV